jgi:hypothetical protein
MLGTNDILRLFELLNEELKASGSQGEIGIVGGAVMCLVFNARVSTKDVDAIFEPSALIRRLADKIAIAEGLRSDWLNDGAKGFIQPGFMKQQVLMLSHLRVWAPDARYMLAMKCISARWDSSDRDDVIFLIKYLALSASSQVISLIEDYYPKKSVPAKTTFFIEEVFDELQKAARKS